MGGPDLQVMEEARAGVADRYGPEARDQTGPRPYSSRVAHTAGRRHPIRGGAPIAASRSNNMSLGASSDTLLLGARLQGGGGGQDSGPLMRGVFGA